MKTTEKTNIGDDLDDQVKPNLKLFPVQYEKQDDLIRLIDTRINFIELKYKLSLLKYLNLNYLNDKNTVVDLKNEQNKLSFIEHVNLLFNLVLDKRTVIVK